MADWIKVEDKLPESHNGQAEWSREMIVLVRHSGYGSDSEPYYEVRIAIYHTRIAQWFEDGTEIIGTYTTERVVAYQELPDPPSGCKTLREIEIEEQERARPNE